MGIVEEEAQRFQSLMDHLTFTFQSGETDNPLVAEFFSWTHRPKEIEYAFLDEIQILVHKIIPCKSSFCLEANKALKH